MRREVVREVKDKEKIKILWKDYFLEKERGERTTN